jgi:hypothetical protein
LLPLTILLTVSAAGNALGQEPAPSAPISLPAGVRARVWVENFPVIRGTLLQSDAKTLHIIPGAVGTVQTVPLASVRRLDLALDRKGNALKGALIGALVVGAAGLGFTVDPDTCKDASSTTFCSRGEAIAGGVLGGGGIGALVGLLIKSDRYTSIDLAPFRRPPTAATRENRRPMSVAFTFRF